MKFKAQKLVELEIEALPCFVRGCLSNALTLRQMEDKPPYQVRCKGCGAAGPIACDTYTAICMWNEICRHEDDTSSEEGK